MWHLWCSDGGFAAVYGLDSTPAKGTQPAKGAQPREATHPLATQAIAEHDMAKYVPMELLSSLSGKLCGHSDISFAKRGDTMYTQKRCNKRTSPYSQDEMAHQEKFAAVSASTRARMKDPGKVMTDMEAFRAQKKYKTFYRFVFNLEWEAYEA